MKNIEFLDRCAAKNKAAIVQNHDGGATWRIFTRVVAEASGGAAQRIKRNRSPRNWLCITREAILSASPGKYLPTLL